ncbi:hypothetical protein HPB48_016316 [Haemaphysalis longicornis]|uniref:Uncharacterized protein n=1 Tax=Haemaphysalis longicornis TaxID=44386 RepID=A0A9J6GWD6_HAELO|nr:hypothetical protein HPB48_016316 [Haemaphysalis longicornis]
MPLQQQQQQQQLKNRTGSTTVTSGTTSAEKQLPTQQQQPSQQKEQQQQEQVDQQPKKEATAMEIATEEEDEEAPKKRARPSTKKNYDAQIEELTATVNNLSATVSNLTVTVNNLVTATEQRFARLEEMIPTLVVSHRNLSEHFELAEQTQKIMAAAAQEQHLQQCYFLRAPSSGTPRLNTKEDPNRVQLTYRDALENSPSRPSQGRSVQAMIKTGLKGRLEVISDQETRYVMLSFGMFVRAYRTGDGWQDNSRGNVNSSLAMDYATTKERLYNMPRNKIGLAAYNVEMDDYLNHCGTGRFARLQAIRNELKSHRQP